MQAVKMITHVLLLVIALVPSVLLQDCIPTPGVSKLTVAQLPANGSSTSRDNYFYIGGLFAVHETGNSPYECGKVKESGIQYLEAFFWALSTFKSRLQDVSPGFKVGGIVFDSCSNEDRLVSQLLSFENCYLTVGGSEPVAPGRVYGYVGPDTSQQAMRLAPIFDRMRKTLVSHGATSAELGNPDKYQFLLRTVPSDAEQVKAIIGILKNKDWKHVQVVYTEDSYGQSGMKVLQTMAKSEGVCVVNNMGVPMNYTTADMDAVLQGLRDNKEAEVVVLFAHDGLVRDFLRTVSLRRARGEFTFIGTNKWGINEEVTDGLETAAEGAITLTLNAQSQAYRTFKSYYEALKPGDSKYNPWFNEFWQEKFNCYLPGQPRNNRIACDLSSQSLADSAMDPYIPYIIMAVDAIIKGVELARQNQCPFASELCSRFANNQARWDVIYQQILQARVDGVGFDRDTGDNEFAAQDIFNFRAKNPSCDKHCYYKVGSYNTETRIDPIYSYDEQGDRRTRPQPSCPSSPCVQCGEDALPVPSTSVTMVTTIPGDAGGSGVKVVDGKAGAAMQPTEIKLRDGKWVIPLVILAGLGVLLTILFEIYLMFKMLGTPFVKHWRTMWLGQLLMLAILLSYLTLFAFAPTPTVATCGIIRFGVGGSYAMIFSVLLVKLMIIMSSKTVGYLKGIYQVLMFVFAWGVQLVLDAEWLILRPPMVIPDNSTDPVTWVCGQPFATHVQTLVYVMFLIVITTILAIRTHGIVTNHREGVFIGLTCGFTLAVWLAWLLLGFLSKHDLTNPALAYGLLITATLALFIMYLPKVRQLNSMGVEGIYAEDDMPDYAASLVAPSIAPGSVAAGSVVYGPPSYKSKNGSMVYVNGGIYSEPPSAKPTHLHYDGDQNALYLRHPGGPTTGRPASVRSAPVGGGIYTLPRRGGAPDSLYATTRVLRMTGELSGKRTISENGFDTQDYGTLQSTRSGGPNSSLPGTLKILYDLEENLSKPEPRSVADLGSL